ncbi:porin family protein [Thiothrix nivea]|uniref:Outer membrane protein beta-barrel domain-containing protein n=1 Tax=Thiothrix nivea (strain ATCC 35100 / DSM 5205 / JP2) TaxID=870187 RepID=A0A656HJW9_THINJ|nr:porin family protein [Thiothrix nivea]EIJ35806.1 hypothetical protein Thini_3291 [Thiothrix nivea DSM 5205]
MEVFLGNRSLSAFVVVSVLMGAETAYAGGIGERYLAVDAGITENSDNTDLYYFDAGSGDYLAERADQAVGVRAGYRVTDKVAIEAGYVDLGRTFDAVEYPDGLYGMGEQKTRALTLGVVGSAALGHQVSAYAKAGVAYYQSKATYDDVLLPAELKVSDTGFTPTVGLGVGYRLSNHLAVNTGFDYYHELGQREDLFDNADNSLETVKSSTGVLSLGLGYSF